MRLQIDKIPVDDQDTWDLICSGNTRGCFQLESPLGRHWCKTIKPRNINEQSDVIALIRPGCISWDTRITVQFNSRNGRRKNFTKIRIIDLYEKFKRNNRQFKAEIISLDEKTNLLVKNKIKNVIYTGQKEVYRPRYKVVYRNTLEHTRFYNLKCTEDHKLLTHDRGWVELKDLEIGERIAVIKSSHDKKRNTKRSVGQSHFRSICFQNYKYKCVFCNWDWASLDVNHTDGNRKTNNEVDNLSFLCPNHHRMFSEKLISKQKLNLSKEQYKLKNTDHIQWVEYSGKDYIGKVNVYDITVEGPNHNFIAGNVVVHNCLEAFSGEPPKNLTRRYADRKHGLEIDEITHPALKELLKTTYAILVYQEQAMAIASVLAGFSETDADTLRKGIGKKLPEVIAKLEGQFIDGCAKIGVLNESQAKEVFEWIRASQRYSFNKSHSTCYAVLGYRTAYCKAHYPIEFYCAYLTGANWKQDTRKEIKELVEDAKKNGVVIKGPDIRDLKEHFYIKNGEVYFGLGDIKDIGASAIKKIFVNIHKIKSWPDFMFKFSDSVSTTVVKALISSGALDYFKIPRQEMLFEVELWNQLTNKEKEYIININPDCLANGLLDCYTSGCKLTRRKESILALIKLRQNPPHSLEDKIEQIVFMEEKYLGVALTYSRLDACGRAPEANFTCANVSNGLGGKEIRLSVELTRVKEITTKNGDKMAFLEVSDNSGNFNEIVVFADQWTELKDILYETNLVLLTGYRGKKGIVVKGAWQI